MSSVKKEEIFIFESTDVWSYVKETSMLKICDRGKLRSRIPPVQNKSKEFHLPPSTRKRKKKTDAVDNNYKSIK